MRTGKELEAHKVQKGRLSCDSDAPQVWSARSDWTRVIKLNHRKTNRRKTRPYCTLKILEQYYFTLCVRQYVGGDLATLEERHQLHL